MPRSVLQPRRWWAPRLRLGRSPARLVGVGLTGVFLTIAVLADWLAPTDPFTAVGPPLLPPSAAYPLGTDDLGRDLLAGVIHGARTSALVVLTVTIVATLIGMLIGALSGYVGGWPDELAMRGSELVMAFPAIILAMAIVVALGPGLVNAGVAMGLVLLVRSGLVGEREGGR